MHRLGGVRARASPTPPAPVVTCRPRPLASQPGAAGVRVGLPQLVRPAPDRRHRAGRLEGPRRAAGRSTATRCSSVPTSTTATLGEVVGRVGEARPRPRSTPSSARGRPCATTARSSAARPAGSGSTPSPPRSPPRCTTAGRRATSRPRPTAGEQRGAERPLHRSHPSTNPRRTHAHPHPRCHRRARRRGCRQGRRRRTCPATCCSSALAGAYVGVAIVLFAVGQRAARRRGLAGRQAGAGRRVRHRAHARGVRRRRALHRQRDGDAAGLVAALGVGRSRSLAVLVASLVGNIVGSIVFAVAVHAGGTLTGPGARPRRLDRHRRRTRASGPQLFWRAVLCNALVCLALWMAARTTSDAAKLVVLWWALLAFIGSGFEHSIANVTTFALAGFEGSIGWGATGPQPGVDGARQRRRRRGRGRPRLRLAGRTQGASRARGRAAGGRRRPRLRRRTADASAGAVRAHLEGTGVAAHGGRCGCLAPAGRASCAGGQSPPRRRARRSRARRARPWAPRSALDARGLTTAWPRRGSARPRCRPHRAGPGPASAARPHRGAAPMPVAPGSPRGRAPSIRGGPAPARRRG